MYRTLLVLLAVTFLQCGCANEPAGGIAVAPAVQQEQPQEEGGIVAGLLEKAKEKTPSLDDMKKMLNDAGEAGGDTVDDTMTLLNDTWKSLKKRGGTHTNDVAEWVADDWNSMNTWEYKVVAVGTDKPEKLEETLNEAGSQRWDCFHVSEVGGDTKFFLKRKKKSYLQNIPLKDMLKLVPLLDVTE